MSSKNMLIHSTDRSCVVINFTARKYVEIDVEITEKLFPAC